VRGVLIVMVLYIAASAYVAGLEKQPRWFANSRALQVTAVGTKYVLAWLPENMRGLLPAPVTPDRRAAPADDGSKAPAPPPGYSSGERKGLNRLFEGTNQGK
jgi:hypothetical protein